MNRKTIVEVGNDLAEFVRDVAWEAIRASGDDADGDYALALAKNWATAVIANQPGDIEYALGRAAGMLKQAALLSEALDLAETIMGGLDAALELTEDTADLDREERSMSDIETAIAAALSANRRLGALILENGGQTQLPLPETPHEK